MFFLQLATVALYASINTIPPIRRCFHCLKEQCTLFFGLLFIDNTHSSFIGRALIACSPPTITQSIFVRSSSPKSSTNGSHDKNRIEAGRLRKQSILYFTLGTSTVTPTIHLQVSPVLRNILPSARLFS